jgi:hypothetical protein
MHGNQPTCARQTWQEEEEEGTIQRTANERTPQQRATDWLSGVTGEDNNVKDIIMQELWGKEDFQNA